MPHQLIFGYGFLGRRLAAEFLAADDTVWTVTRHPEKARELNQAGIRARVANHQQWSELAADRELPHFQSITICVGNDGGGNSDHLTVYSAATLAALALARRPLGTESSPANSPDGPGPRQSEPNTSPAGEAGRAAESVRPSPSVWPSRILFVSTTGVYQSSLGPGSAFSPSPGDPVDLSPPPELTIASDSNQLPVVDERAAVEPRRPGAQASLHCEQSLLQASEVPCTIFRLAGIYSLERIPNLGRLRNQEPIPGSGKGLLNLIHVDDAARILAAAASAPPPWPIINVADGHPVVRHEFYEFLAKKYDLPAPQFSDVGGRGSGDKRIDTTRLQQWDRGPWRYPSYRAGLA